MIKHDSYGRAYTADPMEAKRFRIEDRRPTHFIKSDYMKMKFATEGRWIQTATKEGGLHFLPPAFGESGIPKNEIFFDIDIEFYGFQQTAINYVKDTYDSGKRAAFVISGTGTGKTMMMLGITKKLGMSTVIVVPTTTIAKGVYDTFSYYVDVKIIKGSKNIEFASVNIMTHQTFNIIYEQLNGKIDLLMLDEAHHVPEKRIAQLNRWQGSFICGLTATPERKEFGADGFEHIFGNIYDTDQQSLPVQVYPFHFNYDYNREELTKASEGLSPESPEIYRRLMIQNHKRTETMMRLIKRFQEKGYKKFIVFSDRVDHVKNVAEDLKKEFSNVFEFMGDSDKEEVLKKGLAVDECIIVGNLQCCGEGFNLPALEVGILFVSTQWTVTVDQAVGRVRRKYGNKTHGILIDFVDTIQFGGSKPKKLGRYGRKKIYAEKEWEIIPIS